jgi:hypothetical protein
VRASTTSRWRESQWGEIVRFHAPAGQLKALDAALLDTLAGTTLGPTRAELRAIASQLRRMPVRTWKNATVRLAALGGLEHLLNDRLKDQPTLRRPVREIIDEYDRAHTAVTVAGHVGDEAAAALTVRYVWGLAPAAAELVVAAIRAAEAGATNRTDEYVAFANAVARMAVVRPVLKLTNQPAVQAAIIAAAAAWTGSVSDSRATHLLAHQTGAVATTIRTLTDGQLEIVAQMISDGTSWDGDTLIAAARALA